ncbi:MAG: STAS domain-containing protein [Alphaproteobacteria bacterium]|nr:STAS domain-containing protein [Alphaproteobacteria bacterium]
MRIVEEPFGKGVVVKPIGRLDSTTAPAAEQTIRDALTRSGHRLLLDMAELDYVSSAGLRVVLAAAKQSTAANGRFIVCELRPQVRQVFELSGFTRIITIVDKRADAEL